jgi:hypothetical protein
MSMTFLNAITQLEERLAKKKLISQDMCYGIEGESERHNFTLETVGGDGGDF